MLTIIKNSLDRMRTTGDKLVFLGPTLARLTIGLVFIGTGWGKLHSLDDVTQFFASLHIPAPGFNARLAASTEFFGGILILIGLGTRLAALPVAFTMVIAILTASSLLHLAKGVAHCVEEVFVCGNNRAIQVEGDDALGVAARGVHLFGDRILVVVEVPAEWDTGSRRRELTDKGRCPANQPETPGARPADQLDGGEEKCGKENKDIRAKTDRPDKEIEDFH